MMVIIKDGNASCWKMDIYMIWLCSHTDELIMLMGTQSSDDQLIFGCNMVMCIAIMQSIAPPHVENHSLSSCSIGSALRHIPWSSTGIWSTLQKKTSALGITLLNPPLCHHIVICQCYSLSLIVALDEYPHIPCPRCKA